MTSEPKPQSRPSLSTSAAPDQLSCGGRREDRLVEHVLPPAREFLLGDDASLDALLFAAAADDGHGVADAERIGAAELHRRAVQRQGRLDEREAAIEVVADDEARHHGVARADPEILRLVHDVADRRDQPVGANAHAVTHALGAEQPRAHGVIGHMRRDRHDGIDGPGPRHKLDAHGFMVASRLRAVRVAANCLKPLEKMRQVVRVVQNACGILFRHAQSALLT